MTAGLSEMEGFSAAGDGEGAAAGFCVGAVGAVSADEAETTQQKMSAAMMKKRVFSPCTDRGLASVRDDLK
jgi:hypothetical protein